MRLKRYFIIMFCFALFLFDFTGCATPLPEGGAAADSAGSGAADASQNMPGDAPAGAGYSISLTPEQIDNIHTTCFVLWQCMPNDTCRQVYRNSTVQADAETGAAAVEFDGNLAFINGEIACMYTDTIGEGYVWYQVPAVLNGADVDLRVVFDEGNPVGRVAGAVPVFPNSRATARQLLQVKKGDTLALSYQTKNYSETGDAEMNPYFWSESEARAVGGELSVTVEPAPEGMYFYNFSIVDLQGNTYETDFSEFVF